MPRVVAQHRLEDAQPLARRDHPLRDHGADDRPVHPGREPRDRRDGARVLVAVRHVEEQIARREDAEPLQRLGAHRPDALEVADRRVEGERGARRRARRSLGAHQLPRERRGVEGSEVRRRARPCRRTSPARRSPRARRRTTPPRAVPSSFVTTRPVTGTAAAKILRLLHRVLSDRAVEHEQRLVRRAGQPLRDHARDLLELRHQVVARVQPAGGVDDHARRTPRAMAASIASNATAAGSAPGVLPTNSAPGALRPQRGADRSRRRETCRRRRRAPAAPRRAKRAASLPMNVVFPAPLTPTTRITVGARRRDVRARGSLFPARSARSIAVGERRVELARR